MPKNHAKYILNAVDTVPASAAKDGTIEAAAGSRYVAGTDTKFKSDKTIVEGDWIFANGEIRKIERIISDVYIYLDEAFSAPVAALTDLYITKASRAREISLANIGGAATTVDGSSFSNGGSLSFDETMLYRGAQRDYPDPLVVDGATSSIDVLIVY